MPRNYIIVLKSIARKWFLFVIIIILIVAYIGWVIYKTVIAAVILTAIILTLFALYYFWRIYTSKRIEIVIKKYYRIDDITMAKKVKRSLTFVQEKMFEISQKQSGKNWLMIYLNKHYIFYHEMTIEKFKELYSKGFGDKEILEELKEFNIDTRAEIKAIEENLVKYNRLDKREVSVKDRREKERFKEL